MPTLSLSDYRYAYAASYFEDRQTWPDTARNQHLLDAYNEACRLAAREARSALITERTDCDGVDQHKAKAAHWQSVADSLGAVLSMEIDDCESEIILPDPWR